MDAQLLFSCMCPLSKLLYLLFSSHRISAILRSAPFKAVVTCAVLFDASVSSRLFRSLSSLVWFGYGLTPPMDLIPHLNNQVLLVLAREFPSCDADFQINSAKNAMDL
ncbi:hypothetical protein FANTH_13225 [Fusarium anthophilum]|uniref:Uncharacterized protein n=1 Tax=Fusarium anthophilum TaxID=48485 RepID=A0A8H4YP54_9HYPO|nr:hypothetical protein FANTH_13225 [Fusarium anthophilum]